MPPIKKSYGILCFKEDKGINILMIKKAVTYHFCEFVAGHYQKYDDQHLCKLFDNMTYHEKMDIMSMNFSNMWYRIYSDVPTGSNSWSTAYTKKKSKFESSFCDKNNNRLKRLIADSANVDTPWEFPKGRKDDNEENIDTAIREFYEETGMPPDKYIIMWHVKPYIETYTDFNITYQNIYYFAKSIDTWKPEYRFYSKHQLHETACVRWISKNDLSSMFLEEITFKRLIKCFSKLIKKYKNSFKQKNQY